MPRSLGLRGVGILVTVARVHSVDRLLKHSVTYSLGRGIISRSLGLRGVGILVTAARVHSVDQNL